MIRHNDDYGKAETLIMEYAEPGPQWICVVGLSSMQRQSRLGIHEIRHEEPNGSSYPRLVVWFRHSCHHLWVLLAIV